MKHTGDNKLKILPLATVILLAIFFAVTPSYAATPMPQFALPAAHNGKVVKSEDFKGKVLLITFFATWCPPCRQEVPSLIKLHDEFVSKGFSVIGLSVDEGGAEVVQQMVEQEHINYPILMSDSATIGNFGGVSGIPTTFLINKNGNVVKRYLGYVDHNLLEKDIQTVL